jgi:hypothetical protein
MHPCPEARSEIDFLVECARASLTGTQVAPNSMGNVDWDVLLRFAQQHGLIPCLARDFNHRNDIPAAISSRVEEMARANAQTGLLLTGELLKVVRVLREHGISALPYKGPALAAAAYGDVALRQYCDLDILMSQRDVLRAVKALVARGYRSGLRYEPAGTAAYLHWGAEWPLFSPGGVLIELQWRLAPRYFPVELNIDDLLERATTVALGGGDVPTLAPEDNLLILCVHGGKHRWERLSWMCDVAQLIRSNSHLNWTVVGERARRLGIQRLLWVGLTVAERIVPLTLPGQVRHAMERDRMTARLTACGANLVSSSEPATGGDDAPRAEYFRYQFLIRERMRDRLRFLLRLTFAPGPGEWAMLRLPRALTPLYRIVRLYRLAIRAGKMAAGKTAKARAKMPSGAGTAGP